MEISDYMTTMVINFQTKYFLNMPVSSQRMKILNLKNLGQSVTDKVLANNDLKARNLMLSLLDRVRHHAKVNKRFSMTKER